MPVVPYRSDFYGVTTPDVFGDGRLPGPNTSAQPPNAYQEEERAKASERAQRGELSDLEQNTVLNEVARKALGLPGMASDGGSHTLQPAVRRTLG
jgi:hypothetical protein